MPTYAARCSPRPVTAGSHAGVLFMHNAGYSTMCGHGIIAVTTIALAAGSAGARRRRTVQSSLTATGRPGTAVVKQQAERA